jgi:hypothetical protein
MTLTPGAAQGPDPPLGQDPPLGRPVDLLPLGHPAEGLEQINFGLGGKGVEPREHHLLGEEAACGGPLNHSVNGKDAVSGGWMGSGVSELRKRGPRRPPERGACCR